MRQWLRPRLDWLLVFIPVAAGLEFLAPEAQVLIFCAAGLAIVPLAGWMGKATEHLAAHMGEGIGGLLNATFGNAAELIIGLMALRAGLYDVVKASLTGSIIGNILLVLGAAFLLGGVKHKVQQFHEGGARIQATTMTLATIALVLPAAFHHLGGAAAQRREMDLSFEIAVVLLVTYALGLLFTLKTHKHFFAGHTGEASTLEMEEERCAPWSTGKGLGVLAVATALVAWMSELLVGSVEMAAHALGLSELFVGIIVVAIIGNAAEHSTAVLMALKNRMELSIGIALGSSIQIALFVAPVLLLASYVLGPQRMDLVFTPMEILAVFLSVIIANEISRDGESNWMEGAQLLTVYVLLGIVFYFLPEAAMH